MLENGVALVAQLFRRHGHTHLYILYVPLCPRSAVHPDAAIVEPFRSRLLLKIYGCEYSIGAFAVCAVRIGKVTSHKALVRLDVLKQAAHNVDITLCHRIFLHSATFVERKVEEVDMIGVHSIICTCRTGLATTDQSFDRSYVLRVSVSFFLVGKKLFDVVIHADDYLIISVHKQLVETVEKVHETCHLLVVDGNVTARLVSDVDIMALLYKAVQGSAHRDDVVVGVRRKDDNPLRKGHCTFRTVGVVVIGLAAWPSGNRMLQVIEDSDVAVISRTVESQKLGETVAVIVLVGQFQYRFLRFLAKPHHSGAGELVIPFAVGDQPRVDDAGQLGGGSEVDDHMRVVVSLKKRCGDVLRDRTFYRFLDDVGLVVAPCREEDMAGREYRADAHCDAARRYGLLSTETHRHLFTRHTVDQNQP